MKFMFENNKGIKNLKKNLVKKKKKVKKNLV